MQVNSIDENTSFTEMLRCYVIAAMTNTETRRCTSSTTNQGREILPENTHFRRKMKTSVLMPLTLIISMLSCAVAVPLTSNCDPEDVNSCGFSAVCRRQTGMNRFSQISEKPVYRCVCPKINCFREGFQEPICGVVGK